MSYSTFEIGLKLVILPYCNSYALPNPVSMPKRSSTLHWGQKRAVLSQSQNFRILSSQLHRCCEVLCGAAPRHSIGCQASVRKILGSSNMHAQPLLPPFLGKKNPTALLPLCPSRIVQWIILIIMSNKKRFFRNSDIRLRSRIGRVAPVGLAVG